jgi:hypothetical protein
MRTLRILAIAVLLGLAAGARVGADDRVQALTLLEQAIRAQGGEQELAKVRLMNRSARGVMILFGKEVPFLAETITALPDRFRVNLELSPDEQKIKMIVVVNGDRGWRASGGVALELAKEELDDLREETYVTWLATLVPLKDKAFVLSPLPEISVDGRPAVGLKAARPGHGDVKLYFDKRSHLLVKIERRGREGGLPVDKEYLYREHKNFEGVQLATKYVEMTNGKKFTEVLGLTYSFPRRVDERVFEKP